MKNFSLLLGQTGNNTINQRLNNKYTIIVKQNLSKRHVKESVTNNSQCLTRIVYLKPTSLQTVMPFT